MAVQRRNIFGAKYGSADIEHGKPHAPKIPAQVQPPVPLSIGAAQGQPPELGGAPMPEQGQGQAQRLDPHAEELLQRMLQRFGGGARG